MKPTIQIVLIAAIITAAVMISYAWGAALCGPTEDVVEKLTDDYDEAKIASGAVKGDLSSMELFVNLQTGSWSMLQNTTAGQSCIIAVGLKFRIHHVPDWGTPT